MGQNHEVVITLYPFEETTLYPGFIDDHLDSWVTKWVSDLSTQIVCGMSGEDGCIGLDLKSHSEFYVQISNSEYIFTISVSDELGPILEDDMDKLIAFNPNRHVWGISSIDIDGVRLHDIEDAKSYIYYLFKHNMEVPDSSVIETTFHEHRESERKWYKETVEYRKRLVEEGRLDPQYVYRRVPSNWDKTT